MKSQSLRTEARCSDEWQYLNATKNHIQYYQQPIQLWISSYLNDFFTDVNCTSQLGVIVFLPLYSIWSLLCAKGTCCTKQLYWFYKQNVNQHSQRFWRAHFSRESTQCSMHSSLAWAQAFHFIETKTQRVLKLRIKDVSS